MQVVEQVLGVRVEARVERVARPVVLRVPVHVEDEHVERQAVRLEVAHDVERGLLREVVPAREPDAHRVARRQRDRAADRDEVAQRA